MKKRKKGFGEIFILSILLILIASNVSAITGKIVNGRMIITAELDETISRTIRVINDNNVPVNITIYASGDLKDDIIILDENFVLQPNTEKNARFTVKLTEEGTSTSKINVQFTPIPKANGVGLSAQLIIKTNGEGEEGNLITGEVTQNSDESNNETEISDKTRNTILIIGGVLALILLIILIVLLSDSKTKQETKIETKSNNISKIKEEIKK